MNYGNTLRVELDTCTFAAMAMDFFEDVAIDARNRGDEESAKRYYKTALELARLTRWIEKREAAAVAERVSL
jgi:hypothetical protein